MPPPPGWWEDEGYAENGGSTVDVEDGGAAVAAIGCNSFCCRSIFSRKNLALMEFPDGAFIPAGFLQEE